MKLEHLIVVTMCCWILSTDRAQSSTIAQVTCGQYQVFPGKQALGAISQTGINLQPECEAFCSNTPTCFAYEFDSKPDPNPHCWIHFAPVNTNDLFDDPTITLNVITSRGTCTSSVSPSGSSPSSTSPTSTTSGPPFTGGACGNFQSFEGQHALFAQPVQGITDRQTCLDNCLSTSQCTAYEFDTIHPQFRCWYHFSTVNTADLFNDNPNVTLYVLSRFPCTSTVSVSTTTVSGSVSSTTTGTTTSGVTSNGNCFQSFANTNALNAVQITEAKSDSDCRTVCLGSRTCTAYEADLINPASFICWIHNAPLGELFQTNGVTLNVRISCETTTSGPSTSTGPTDPGLCVVFAQPLTDTQSIGAIGRGGLSDQACMNLCRFDATCVAYEIDNVLPDRCWTHHDIRNLDVVYDTQFVDQFRVLSRECTTTGPPGVSSSTTSPSSTTSGSPIPGLCASYTRLNNTQSINGLPQTGVNTPAACENRCTSNAQCVAYELDTNPADDYCWIHTNQQDLLILYDSDSVTQFQLSSRGPCSSSTTSVSTTSGPSSSTGPTSSGSSTTSGPSGPSSTTSGPSSTSGSSSTSASSSSASTTSGCQFTWTPIANMNVPGGTPNRATDLPSCQLACTNNLYCIGIDTNANNGQFFCYVITVNATMSSFPGNTHYTLTRGPGCPTGPPTNPPSTTTGPTTATEGPNPGCPYFRVIVGENADGGIQLGRMSRQDCLVACLRDASCYAVDYSVAEQTCFSHTSLSGAQMSACCIRYECATSPCTETFDRFPDSSPSLSLGEVQNSITDVTACRNACTAKNCTRLSFINGARIPSQSCYLYYENGTKTGREPVTTQAGIDLYVRKRCIPSPILPPTTTAGPPGTVPPSYCPIDLVFIIDSSGSIRDNQPPGVDNWALIKTFVKDIISTYLNIGSLTDHVAVVTFSDAATLNFDFNKYTDAGQMLTAIDNLPFIGYETNTPAALAIGERLYSDPSLGSRTRSAKFAVLVTDGVVSPQWQSQYQPNIDLLKQYAKARYAIGVTTQISVSELLQYTESGDAYTTVLSFSDLQKVRTDLGYFINSVDCNGNVVLTSLMSSTGASTTTVSGGQPSSSTVTGSSGSTVSSTTTPVSTTTTMAPTTTAIPQGGEGTFGAITRTSTTGAADPLRFPTLLANRNNVYVPATDSFVASAVSGFYFIQICGGAPISTSTEIATRGAYPPLSFAWLSTAHNGVVSSCRGGVLSMTRGVRVYLQQISSAAYSNNDGQTSWSMFDVSDIILNPFAVLSALHRQPVVAPQTIPFINPISNPPGQFDPSRYQYICGSTSGIFFFSFSVGVQGGQTASARLIGLNNAYEITTSSTTHNSVITLDRTVVAQCNAAGRVSVQVTAGQIAPGGSAQGLISFQAFPYQLSNTSGTPACWGLYRSTSLTMNSVATDPVQFDVTEVTQGVSVSNSVVTLTSGGYYYIYMSAGCPAGQRVYLTLRVNSQIMFSVIREATNDNGIVTIGHGMVLRLQAGDTVKVVSDANAAAYSARDGLHTSLVGIRLYAS